jgi:hypothetical protein
VLDAIKLLLIIYLLFLALLAPLGLHRPLLVYPARAIYSFFALFLLLFSFGRLRVAAPVRSAFRRSKRQSRSLQGAIRDWRREKEEERIIWSSSGQGDDPLAFLRKDSDQEK